MTLLDTKTLSVTVNQVVSNGIITKFSIDKTEITLGEKITYNGVVKNTGTNKDSFKIKFYANNVLILDTILHDIPVNGTKNTGSVYTPLKAGTIVFKMELYSM